MTKPMRPVAAACLGLLALALTAVRVDREFINLTPSPGSITNFISLETGHEYTQTFPATRRSLSRLGFYLRPAAPRLADSAVEIAVHVEGRPKARQRLPAAVFDSDGAAQIQLSEPVPLQLGEKIQVTITVPPELSGQIRALIRTPDETFDAAYARFTIDGAIQDSPLAYQAYYAFRPPLAWQAAGLLLVLATLILFPRRPWSPPHTLAAAAWFSLLYTASAILLGEIPWANLAATTLAFAALAILLKRSHLSLPAVLIGASLFAFTTWWPLHLAGDWQRLPDLASSTVRLNDVFLDPRQTPSANGGQFDHFGSYLGIIAIVVAVLGAVSGLRRIKSSLLLAICYALLITGLLLSRIFPDLVIISTFAIAVFAAHGLEALYTFLGKDRLALALCSLIALLVLFDLFHVGARTFEFFLL